MSRPDLADRRPLETESPKIPVPRVLRRPGPPETRDSGQMIFSGFKTYILRCSMTNMEPEEGLHKDLCTLEQGLCGFPASLGVG